MRLRVVVLAVVGALVASGCSGGGDQSAPSTTSAETVPETVASTTTRPTTTLPGRPRTTTTVPVELGPGAARITGTVVGPEGPVNDASVRIERLVGAQVAVANLTAFSGSFNLPSIRGGTYRVRAWKQPDLVLVAPEAFFLGSDEVKTLELRLTRVGDLSVQTTWEPNPPPPSEPFTVNVLVYTGSVTDQGVVLATARPGQPVTIFPGNGLALAGAERGTTDGSGKIGFRVRCTAAGPPTAEVLVNATRLPLALPSCPAGG